MNNIDKLLNQLNDEKKDKKNRITQPKNENSLLNIMRYMFDSLYDWKENKKLSWEDIIPDIKKIISACELSSDEKTELNKTCVAPIVRSYYSRLKRDMAYSMNNKDIKDTQNVSKKNDELVDDSNDKNMESKNNINISKDNSIKPLSEVLEKNITKGKPRPVPSSGIDENIDKI